MTRVNVWKTTTSVEPGRVLNENFINKAIIGKQSGECVGFSQTTTGANTHTERRSHALKQTHTYTFYIRTYQLVAIKNTKILSNA